MYDVHIQAAEIEHERKLKAIHEQHAKHMHELNGRCTHITEQKVCVCV